jgi:hypothetical protein
MRLRNSARSIAVDGERALVTELSSDSPFAGETETDLVVTVSRPEGLFYMVLVMPRSQAANAQPVFQRMLESIRFAR